MGSPCALLLLAVRLMSEGAAVPPPPPAPPPTSTPAPSVTTAPEPEVDAPKATPSPTRLALRDPFEPLSPSLRYRAPVSPDLLDPFARPTTPSSRPRPSADLRDPFVDGAPQRCATSDGVPLQRPRSLEPVVQGCAPLDRPLRNPFVPIETTTRTATSAPTPTR